MDKSPLSIRTSEEFIFNLSAIISAATNNGEDEEGLFDQEKKRVKEDKSTHVFNFNNSKMKQLNIDHFIKR